MESNNGDSKAHKITESLKVEEAMQAKKFISQTDSHFRMTCSDEEELNKLKFVAEKSFRYGFQRGMLAVFDAMDRHRKEVYGVE
jgi:hypothetical protein